MSDSKNEIIHYGLVAFVGLCIASGVYAVSEHNGLLESYLHSTRASELEETVKQEEIIKPENKPYKFHDLTDKYGEE